MRVVIGSDHAGFDQKERIKAHLVEQGHDVQDVGAANADDSVDYPDFAIAASRIVASGDADLGVLVCGTGIGMSIAANKVRGVRAANVRPRGEDHGRRERAARLTSGTSRPFGGASSYTDGRHAHERARRFERKEHGAWHSRTSRLKIPR